MACRLWIKVVKNCSYRNSAYHFPHMVKVHGLMLLIAGDISVNPGPVLGLVNARSIRNKGQLLSDITSAHNLDFFCLTETHIRTSDTDSLLKSVTPNN